MENLSYLACCGICSAQSLGHIPGYHQSTGRGMNHPRFHTGPHHRLRSAFHIHLHLEKRRTVIGTHSLLLTVLSLTIHPVPAQSARKGKPPSAQLNPIADEMNKINRRFLLLLILQL